MKTKKCPFNNGKQCMKEECALFDEEILQCEFKNIAEFIGECFTDIKNDLIDVIRGEE